MSCPLCERVSNPTYPYLIHEFKNSFLYLGEHQYYKGYCVLVSKTHYREMTDMPEPMRSELFQEMMKAHEVIQKVFNPKKMNMCSLGNVVDHIHWHFFPRYESDANFKNPPWLQMKEFDSAKVAPRDRDELIEMLKKNFWGIFQFIATLIHHPQRKQSLLSLDGLTNLPGKKDHEFFIESSRKITGI